MPKYNGPRGAIIRWDYWGRRFRGTGGVHARIRRHVNRMSRHRDRVRGGVGQRPPLATIVRNRTDTRRRLLELQGRHRNLVRQMAFGRFSHQVKRKLSGDNSGRSTPRKKVTRSRASSSSSDGFIPRRVVLERREALKRKAAKQKGPVETKRRVIRVKPYVHPDRDAAKATPVPSTPRRSVVSSTGKRSRGSYESSVFDRHMDIARKRRNTTPNLQGTGWSRPSSANFGSGRATPPIVTPAETRAPPIATPPVRHRQFLTPNSNPRNYRRANEVPRRRLFAIGTRASGLGSKMHQIGKNTDHERGDIGRSNPFFHDVYSEPLLTNKQYKHGVQTARSVNKWRRQQELREHYKRTAENSARSRSLWRTGFGLARGVLHEVRRHRFRNESAQRLNRYHGYPA